MRRPLRAEEELVLLVAGTRARRQQTASRARELLGRVGWDRVLDDLAYQRLLPLLGGRIVEMAAADAPPEFARAVREETLALRETGTLLELTTLRVATALEVASVPNVPLKGPLLARSLHGDPGMRFSRDIDVLVARKDFPAAIDALRPLGWRPEPSAPADPVLHLVLRHEAGLPDIELHWRVHWYEAEFGTRALTRSQHGSDGVRRLRPEDDLAALMLYQARDGFAGLRHPTDIAAWWDAHASSSAEPAVLESTVHAHPALGRALTASALVLDRLLGVPAARLVSGAACAPWGARRAVALANPLMRGTPQQITAEVSLVDGLLSPKGERLAFFRRRALPNARDLPASSRPLAIARAEHTLRVVRRYAMAALRSRPALR